MPTYEYRCPTGHDFEQIYSKISDSKSALPCPRCGEIAERRISGGAGLLFKGSGFYITDYGKDGKKEQKAPATLGDTAAAAPSSGAEGGGGKGGESKQGESQQGGSKPAESKGAESKRSESKGSESKRSESKGSDTKPAAPAPAPAKPTAKPPKPTSGGGE